jgi:hypothetical protein
MPEGFLGRKAVTDNLRAKIVSAGQETCSEIGDFVSMRTVVDSRDIVYEIFRLRHGE